MLSTFRDHSKNFYEKLEIVLLSMREILAWTVEANIGYLQQAVAVLKTERKNRPAQNVATILAAADYSLLRKVGRNRSAKF